MSYARPQGDYGRSYGRPKGDWADVWTGIKTIGGQVLGGMAGGWLAGATGGQYIPPPVGSIPTGMAPPTGGPIMVPPTFPGGAGAPGTFLIPGQGRLPPFTAGGPGVLPGGGRGGGLVPSGYHYAKDGSMRIVRNRRMNIANPRALRRAMRRVQGFEKLAKRTISFTRRVRMKKRKSS